jgi:hypothetical protein
MYYVVVSNTYQDYNHNFLLLGSQLQRRCFELYFKDTNLIETLHDLVAFSKWICPLLSTNF